MTHRPLAAKHGEEAFEGAPDALVRRLAAEGVRRIYVDGGVVIQQFLAARLVDDMTISIIPIVLGAGIPLFGGTEQPLTLDGAQSLTLDGAQSFESGLVQLRYRCAR